MRILLLTIMEDSEIGRQFSIPIQENGKAMNIQADVSLRRKVEFEKSFLPLIDNLYSMALRMTRNPDDAEDLVADTYLKAYRFYDNFRADTNSKAWIMTIMVNTFRTNYRKLQREPMRVNYDEIENLLPYSEPDSLRQPADRSEIPTLEKLTKYLRSAVSDDIVSALEMVPVQYRMPVLLSDVERFNYQEISEILGINIGTVKSRIFRGRVLLKKHLCQFAASRGICKK
jgi:RNA polymerase sigma-70 factor (ECF subfamily)